MPLDEGMASQFSILAWRMPRTEEPGGGALVHRATKSQIRLSNEHFHHCWELVQVTHFYKRGHWDLERKLLFQGEGGRTEEPSCPGSCAPLTTPWTHLKVSFPSELHQPWRLETHPEPTLAVLIASIQAGFPSGTLPGRRPDPSLLGSRPRLPRWNSTRRNADPALPRLGCLASSGTCSGWGGLAGSSTHSPGFPQPPSLLLGLPGNPSASWYLLPTPSTHALAEEKRICAPWDSMRGREKRRLRPCLLRAVFPAASQSSCLLLTKELFQRNTRRLLWWHRA